MSAYGDLPSRDSPILPATRWRLPSHASLTVSHLTASTMPPDLAALLHAHFAAELDRGTTYPQEGPISRTAFEAYFLVADVFVAICDPPDQAAAQQPETQTLSTIDKARAGRLWDDCLGGTYYVKQNYPGRSGHICNAGFIVPPHLRGRGIATALARSFLHYAPRLGYQASIFNLVYVNNVASVRIWERLGFEKIGRIPRAGRLKRAPENGGGEEYVDAWVIYKNFADVEGLSNDATSLTPPQVPTA